MAERRVTITISAKDSFSTVLNKYNAALGQAHSQTQSIGQSSQGMFAKFRQGIGSVTGLVGAFAGLAALRIGLNLRDAGEAAKDAGHIRRADWRR